MAIHANFLLRGPQGTSSQATHRGLTALCCLAEEHAAKQRLAAARSEAEEELARLNALRQEAAQSHANNAAAHQEADTLSRQLASLRKETEEAQRSRDAAKTAEASVTKVRQTLQITCNSFHSSQSAKL
jgi:hypothetical protein